MGFCVAIDGPAGAGKSTIARLLSKELSFIYVDTGAMYRAIAYYYLKNGIDVADEKKVVERLDDITVSIEYDEDVLQVILNGENVSGYIRTQEVGFATSTISKIPDVREKLLSLQRELAENNNVVMDGRDIGTCVIPDAPVKIFLTASVQKRALRRWKELKERGISEELINIEKEITARDEQDMNRKTAPLKKAEDAILLDSSDMNIEEVVAEMKRIVGEKWR